MIVRLEAESHEFFPPLMLAQVQKAVTNAIEAYGLHAVMKTDLSNKMDAEQRWWNWLKQEQEKDGG